ncbi:MAG: RNA-binding protein [Candidatus Delongbacteria bacterium]|nr:RNA-binding protein [Candidatus Delongbacteria bacterium]MBN2835205.1 RNA-binding protein [Candidatus Delongbacteria bacterium]
MDIYVGNIPYGLSEDELKKTFEVHGAVTSARIIKDKETGRSKGFGFVNMPNNEEAQTAIKEMDGHDYNGRPLRVNEARGRN